MVGPLPINYFHKAPKGWIRDRDNRNPFLLMLLLLFPFIIAIILDELVYKGGFFDISGNPHWPACIAGLVPPACTIGWFYLFRTNDIAVVFQRIYDDIDPAKVIVGIEKSIPYKFHPIKRMTENPFGGAYFHDSFVMRVGRGVKVNIKAVRKPAEPWLNLLVISSKHGSEPLKEIMDALLVFGEGARLRLEDIKGPDETTSEQVPSSKDEGDSEWNVETRWSYGAITVTFMIFVLLGFIGVQSILSYGESSEDRGDLIFGILWTQLMLAIVWLSLSYWFEFISRGIAYSYSRTFHVSSNIAIRSLERSLMKKDIPNSSYSHIDFSAREVLRFDLQQRGRGRTFIDVSIRRPPDMAKTVLIIIHSTSRSKKTKVIRDLVEDGLAS